MESLHHVIPQPIAPGPSSPPTNNSPPLNQSGTFTFVNQTVTNAVQNTGEFNIIFLIVLLVLVTILAYWAITIASKTGKTSVELRETVPEEWTIPSGIYTYSGPRKLLRKAFLKARHYLEQAIQASLKAYTIKEISSRIGSESFSSIANMYSAMMYSGNEPTSKEAENLAIMLEEEASRWREKGSS